MTTFLHEVKDKRLIEYLPQDPWYVIDKEFEHRFFYDLRDNLLPGFLRAALTNNENNYQEGTDRGLLLDFYHALQVLLQAVYILYGNRQYDNKNELFKNWPEERRHFTTWRQELNNPMQVVTNFYDRFPIEYIRREVRHWIEASVEKTDESRKEFTSWLAFYTFEHIECITEAVYCLSGQHRENRLQQCAPVYTIDPIKRIIPLIVETCQPDKIFLLHAGLPGEKAGLMECNFLVLLPGSSAKPYKEYQSLIDEKCLGWASVLITFNKTNEAYKYLEAGHLFYSVVCKPEKRVYDYGTVSLPSVKSFDTKAITEKAHSLFNADCNKANAFLEGAKFYQKSKEFNFAAFLLHQAAERTMAGLIYALTGHSYFTHNLFRLLQHCRCFTNGLTAAFQQQTDKEKELLNLLNNAYSKTRYRYDYSISENDLKSLFEKVTTLRDAAIQAVEEQLIGFEKMFS